jgi:hypothetical protein
VHATIKALFKALRPQSYKNSEFAQYAQADLYPIYSS